MSKRVRLCVLVLATFGLTRPQSVAAQGGTGAIEGRVIETESGRPVVGAQVIISGTAIRAVTNEAGQFRIGAVPARQVDIRVRTIGFAPATRSVVVGVGQTARADFQLSVS